MPPQLHSLPASVRPSARLLALALPPQRVPGSVSCHHALSLVGGAHLRRRVNSTRRKESFIWSDFQSLTFYVHFQRCWQMSRLWNMITGSIFATDIHMDVFKYTVKEEHGDVTFFLPAIDLLFFLMHCTVEGNGSKRLSRSCTFFWLNRLQYVLITVTGFDVDVFRCHMVFPWFLRLLGW